MHKSFSNFKIKKPSFHTLRDYLMIIVGATIMGGSIAMLIDSRVVPGGISGVAIAIHYLSGETWPVGLMLWMMNIPLFIWGVRSLGLGFALRTVVGFTFIAFAIDLFSGAVPGLGFIGLNKSEAIVDLLHNDFLFLIFISAVLLGVGSGLVFKYKGTTGGADIVAAILNRRFNIKVGRGIIYINIIVISFATYAIHIRDLSPDRPALSLALYALLLTFITSRIIDVLLDGFDYARSALIISDRSAEISEAIIQRMSRGATALKGRGLYRNIDRDILMTVITRNELSILEEIIQEIDPKAFVIISTVHEVLGEGFRRRS